MPERDESLLSGNNLVSFAYNVCPALRQDILDCLHHARLVADDLHSPRQSWRSWLDTYQRTISATGGQLDARIEEARLKIHRFRDIGKLRLPAVSNSVELRQLYLRSLDSLLASEHAQTFFNNWFISGRFESFQIIPCAMQSEEEATIMLCSMQMSTLALRPALYFWQILGGEMQVHTFGTAFRFNRQRFEPFRQTVQDALSDRAIAEIVGL
ncbi:Uncharacterized protein ABJ99_3927 [Pseudomonas syringae pv. cilantro]|uniref:Uncharacterized protein n=2 Tax=Pseudomonas syringae group TaxID=136849 RepID=A0A0N1JQ09_PSESX|nr:MULTISPECIES: hypothetical protein [Pseudomonas syringae group]KPC35517.1 Uncharacterized protein ABJ99_3927 [Pseudomonas syringae pv. cilantro]KPW81342.1 Uncharacterized protein ALO76_01801 [Pseudomonas syringae pv. coriandricola]RMN07086.1 hypothetical protein ALQ65_02853 [Pseudomonas syringae pv. coriandricola]